MSSIGSKTPEAMRGDDPRLEGWYHTIELGGGLVTKGYYDHRPVLWTSGIPEDLSGKTVLDVGTSDGFYAFEMEARGAAKVVAVDVARSSDWDWLPQLRADIEPDPMVGTLGRFRLAAKMRQSKVEHRTANIYDLSPETVGQFDFVFCGSLILHLQSPLKALSALRSVTREMAVVEFCCDAGLDAAFPNQPCARFGIEGEDEPGQNDTYWQFNTAGMKRLLEYAGFEDLEAMPVHSLNPHPAWVRSIRAVPRPLPSGKSFARTPTEFSPKDHPTRADSTEAESVVSIDPAVKPFMEFLRDRVNSLAEMPELQSASGFADLHRLAEIQYRHIGELETYVAHVLGELNRTTAHLHEVESYVTHLEAELASKNKSVEGSPQAARSTLGRRVRRRGPSSGPPPL